MEVNKLSGASESNGSYRRLSDAAPTPDNDDVEMARLDRDGILSSSSPSSSTTATKAGTSGELSGIYFGILNIYTTVPQFIGTLISMVVFALLEPGKSPELHGGEKPPSPSTKDTDGPNAVAVCLFIGAMGATLAIFVTRKLRFL